MALYLFSLRTIGRGQGRSAVGAAAYRSGEQLKNERDGKIYDFTYRKDIVHTEILLPNKSPPDFSDRKTLWNIVEQTENRRDSRLAKEVLVALPRELALETSITLVQNFVKENFVSLGMCADVAIHIGHCKDSPYIEADHDNIPLHNPHGHIMLTDRPVDREGFHLKKNPSWNAKHQLIEWREQWAAAQNKMFQRKGLSARVSHESYKKRGINREPSIHLGPTLSALERNGRKTMLGNKNRDIEARNKEHDKRQHELEFINEKELEMSR